MYRINLYPEFGHRRRATRRRQVHGTCSALLFGSCLLAIGVLLLSSHLLRDRAASLRVATERMAALVEASTNVKPEQEAARELWRLRQRRIDWSPKLAAVAERTLPSITLTQVDGNMPARGVPAGLNLTGEVSMRSAQLEQVSTYLGSLADDQRIALQLPQVELGNLKGSADGRFMISCGPDEGGS